MALPTRLLARLQLILTALLFSTGGMGVKSCGLGNWQVASFRSGVAVVTLLAVLPAARRLGTWRSWCVGAAYAATMLLFVSANKTTTAANAIFLQSTAPIYILLLGPLLLGERNRRRDLLFMGVMAVGLGLFFLGRQGPIDSAPNPFLGNILAAAAGFTWALTLVGLRWLTGEGGAGRGRDTGASAVLAGNVLACAFALPMALPVVGSVPADWLWILYLGSVQIALAYVLMTTALRHLGALETALILLLEPVLNPLWAWFSHGEVPGPWAMLGGALILAATVAKTWLERGRDRARAAGVGRDSLEGKRSTGKL